LNSVQTWVTKTHGTYPDLFSGNHLLTVQKPVSEWYVIEQFIGSIAEWSEQLCTTLMQSEGYTP